MRLAGLMFVVVGAAVVISAGWALRASKAQRRLRFQVVARESHVGDCVLVPVAPEPGGVLSLRLAEDQDMSAVNAGDVLWVWPDPMMPSRVRPYRPEPALLWAALAVTGVVLGSAGVVLLQGGGRAGDLIEATGTAIAFPLVIGFEVCLGTVGLAGLAHLALTWKGSRRVSGPVVAVEVLPQGRKNTYRPLVEHPADDGGVRKVWGVPRWFRPELGRVLTVRVAGRPPYEAMRTTPMSAFVLLLFLFFGLLGWVLLSSVFGTAPQSA
ncbi:hypothetical protein GCM10022247_05940 [Allokutzneria multivorans]|uniref:DUF3592 domain-containing protein n=1 Tax=Allokutzneria multivorans TaxID=1142134 RepID=A0ABP7QZ80_9PSEU